MFVCLFAGLPAGLHKDNWMDFHETWMENWSLINLWIQEFFHLHCRPFSQESVDLDEQTALLRSFDVDPDKNLLIFHFTMMPIIPSALFLLFLHVGCWSGEFKWWLISYCIYNLQWFRGQTELKGPWQRYELYWVLFMCYSCALNDANTFEMIWFALPYCSLSKCWVSTGIPTANHCTVLTEPVSKREHFSSILLNETSGRHSRTNPPVSKVHNYTKLNVQLYSDGALMHTHTHTQ